MKNKDWEKPHEHVFWADRNPPGCFGCGKTEEELIRQKIRTEVINEVEEWANKRYCHPENIVEDSNEDRLIRGCNIALDDLLSFLSDLKQLPKKEKV